MDTSQELTKDEEDEENDEDGDSEESSSDGGEGSVKKAAQALTCRKVTLNMLMEDGLIQPGAGVLSIDYLGQKFEADLLPSGKIRWHGSEEEFGTPSAWALHCKRLVNPVKRSGCGWASVKYKNKKLDIWKSIWARKQRQSTSKSPQTSPGLKSSSSSVSLADQVKIPPGLASPAALKGSAWTSPALSPPSHKAPVMMRLVSPPSGSTIGPASSPTTSVASTASLASLPLVEVKTATDISTVGNTTSNAVIVGSTSPKASSEPATPRISTSTAPQSSSPSSQEQQQQQQQQQKQQEQQQQEQQEQEQLQKQQPIGPHTQDQSEGPPKDSVVVKPIAVEKTPEKESHNAPALKSDTQPQPTAQVPPAEGNNHSPPKRAKQEGGFSLTLSRELPSPTPGPLPPRAILHQPVRSGRLLPSLEGKMVESAWDSSYRQHHHHHHQQQQLHHHQQQQGHGGKNRRSVLYSSLGQRGLDVDPLLLIKCEQFDSLSKIQPFTVSTTSNTLLLMDFHCHLTKSEVVGYLGGRWDCQRQHLSIEQAFPARCRLGDKDRATFIEDEIRRGMRDKGLMVVGWYHSHPTCSPDPSIRDLDCQMAYQLRMRGTGAMYLPCVGFILSPFEKFPPKQDSKIQCFWVMPNLEHPTSFNIPMHVSYSVVRDLSLTEDLLSDLKILCEFYSGAIDRVYLKEQWGEAITYMDKIKASLRNKLPEDQLDSSTFLDYVQQLLGDMKYQYSNCL